MAASNYQARPLGDQNREIAQTEDCQVAQGTTKLDKSLIAGFIIALAFAVSCYMAIFFITISFAP
jgi:hypothetical protein